MSALQKEEDSKPKVKEHTMVLFSHPDFGTKFLADLDKQNRVIVEPGWVFHVEVDLKAQNADCVELWVGQSKYLTENQRCG